MFSDRTSAVTLENAIDSVGFDEAGYLAGNPDVAAAVAGGAFASGYEHFVSVTSAPRASAIDAVALVSVTGRASARA